MTYLKAFRLKLSQGYKQYFLQLLGFACYNTADSIVSADLITVIISLPTWRYGKHAQANRACLADYWVTLLVNSFKIKANVYTDLVICTTETK